MMVRWVLFAALMGSGTSWAIAPPSSPEELEAAASLIVDGHITEVTCVGAITTDSNGVTRTPYQARLERRGNPIKGPAFDFVYLPFEGVDFGGGPSPGCAWFPLYPRGMSGRFWLTERQGGDAQAYRLVARNAFEAAHDHAPQELPTCGEGPDPLPDAGPVQMDGGSADPERADAGAAATPDGGAVTQPDAGVRQVHRPGEPAPEESSLLGCSQTGSGLSWVVLFALVMLRRKRLVPRH